MRYCLCTCWHMYGYYFSILQLAFLSFSLFNKTLVDRKNGVMPKSVRSKHPNPKWLQAQVTWSVQLAGYPNLLWSSLCSSDRHCLSACFVLFCLPTSAIPPTLLCQFQATVHLNETATTVMKSSPVILLLSEEIGRRALIRQQQVLNVRC